MSLLAVLPAVAFLFILTFLIIKNWFGLRFSFLWAALISTAAAVAMTEALSLLHALTRTNVATGWVLVSLVAMVGIILSGHSRKSRRGSLQTVFKVEYLLGGLTAVIFLIVGVSAFFSAPNNWDSMTYHLPRILHWIQNHSVEHYPTPILRQLYQPPGAEFLILQFQILTGDDRFANLVQWFAMLASALVLSLIAAELGAGRKGQLLTMLLAATIPMGILQGTSTQNDYVAGLWLSAAVLFGLKLLRPEDQGSQRLGNLIGAGLSLGLALLTKGTVYLFAAPWIASLLLFSILQKRKKLFLEMFLVAMMCLAVNAGFYLRNINLFGTPLSPGSEDYVNKGDMISNGMLNVVRNAALHMGTPLPAVNHFLKEKILVLQSWSKHTENNSWSDFDIPVPSTNEDIAGNPLHFFIILVVFTVIAFARNSSWLLRSYSLMIIAGFALFCMLLKWQLFHSRLHLPLFLLSMPVVAFVLERMRPKLFVPIIAVILVAAAVPALFWNERHPLVGKKNIFNMSRMEQYFSYRQFMALPYVLAAKYASSHSGSDVGLLLGGDDWEYPLWMLLKKEKPDVRIYHLGVSNVSAPLLLHHRENVALMISEMADPPMIVSVEQKKFLKRQQFSFMSVYETPRP